MKIGGREMNERNRMGKIPLVIGVTGHLEIRDEDRDVLRETAKSELKRLQERCPHTPVVMLCALARGADLLCADAAEENGIPLWAALPMDRAEYEKDFSPEDLTRLAHHIARAEKMYTAPAAEKAPESQDRDFCYRQCGIHIAEHCQILLALWDGGEDRSGCGCAAAVNALLEGRWEPERGSPGRERPPGLPERCGSSGTGTPWRRSCRGRKNSIRLRKAPDRTGTRRCRKTPGRNPGCRRYRRCTARRTA